MMAGGESSVALSTSMHVPSDSNIVKIKASVRLVDPPTPMSEEEIDAAMEEGWGSEFPKDVVADTTAEDGILDGTIGEVYVNSRITSLRPGALTECNNLISVYMTACSVIGDDAFAYCENLQTAVFPECLSIDFDAFGDCYALTTLSFPKCTFIGNYTFGNCDVLQRADFPACTHVSVAAFNACYELSDISFPVCECVDANAFANCPALSSVYFPKATEVRYSAFYACSGLHTAVFPECQMIGRGRDCNVFNRCANLMSLYLLGSTVVTLGDTNAFTSTPISGYNVSDGNYGSVYVRASLLTAYRSAQNWSVYASRIAGLTDEEIASLDFES